MSSEKAGRPLVTFGSCSYSAKGSTQDLEAGLEAGLAAGLAAGLGVGAGSANGSADAGSFALGSAPGTLVAARIGRGRAARAGFACGLRGGAKANPARISASVGAATGIGWMTMVGSATVAGAATFAGCTGAAMGARRGATRPLSVNVTAIPSTNVVAQRAINVPLDLSLAGCNAAAALAAHAPRSRSASKILSVGTPEARVGIASSLLCGPPAISIRNDLRPMNTTLSCSPPSELITSAVSFTEDSTSFTVGIAYRLR